jgi:3',5'-cyclic AMP phosphodiesterase CpdA
MSGFIVNPPIKNDANYYRNDDNVVQRILRGECMLVPGLRRSGKTSFLYKVERAAKAAGLKSLFFDLPDFFVNENPAKEVKLAAQQIAASVDAIILMDEAEAFKDDPNHLAQLLKACHNRTLVMSSAPVFVLELDRYPDLIQKCVEGLHRHLLGPLSWDESLALLSQSKLQRPSPLKADAIEEVKQSGDRLPIILQALGAKYADDFALSVSLAGLGTRILQGLTPKAKDAFISAAHGGRPASDSTEVKLLTALGALRCDQDGAQVAGQTLNDVIRESSQPPNVVVAEGARPNAAQPAEDWQPYASILHLSDLHFGPHCIEPHASASQFTRLKSILEKDGIVPDFIVVTGDLSWSGHRDELKEAEKFLESLAKWTAKRKGWKEHRGRGRFILIPGNHEAAWSLTNGLTDAEVETWSCYSLAPFASFVNRFHGGDVFWDVERPCQIRSFKEPSLAFISVSTSHLITQKSKRGRFGDAVRNEVVRLLDTKDVKNARFRICLIHHNLRSFHDDGQVIQDAERAMLIFRKCKPGFDFILHGHVHQGEVSFFAPREGASIPYSAVGSFGVRVEHRPGDDVVGRVGNEFALVYLETNGTGRRFTTQFYQLNYTPTGDYEWQPGKRVTSDNL